MKNSFTLFSTLLLILMFSIISVKIFENKNISSQNTINQYNYIQAKNHLKFLEQYVRSLDSLELLNKIEIKDTNFEVYALIKKQEEKFDVELIVEEKDSSVRVYKRVEI